MNSVLHLFTFFIKLLFAGCLAGRKVACFLGEQLGHWRRELYWEKSWHSWFVCGFLPTVSCLHWQCNVHHQCTAHSQCTIRWKCTTHWHIDYQPHPPPGMSGQHFAGSHKKTVKSIKRHGSATSVFFQAHLGNISCFIARWQHCLR